MTEHLEVSSVLLKPIQLKWDTNWQLLTQWK